VADTANSARSNRSWGKVPDVEPDSALANAKVSAARGCPEPLRCSAGKPVGTSGQGLLLGQSLSRGNGDRVLPPKGTLIHSLETICRLRSGMVADETEWGAPDARDSSSLEGETVGAGRRINLKVRSNDSAVRCAISKSFVRVPVMDIKTRQLR